MQSTADQITKTGRVGGDQAGTAVVTSKASSNCSPAPSLSHGFPCNFVPLATVQWNGDGGKAEFLKGQLHLFYQKKK